jgi:small subunit ribosomal protein S5
MATAIKKKLDAGSYQLKDQVVAINRVTKVVKGGKNMSFAALVVVGDPAAGVVGYGSGKAKEVPQAIRKGIESAKKNLVKVNLTQNSIPHQVLGRFGSGMVLRKPAPAGTGVIAGGAVRAVVEAAGIRDILTKSLGSSNALNTVLATIEALRDLHSFEFEAARRGRSVAALVGARRAAQIAEAAAEAAAYVPPEREERSERGGDRGGDRGGRGGRGGDRGAGDRGAGDRGGRGPAGGPPRRR